MNKGLILALALLAPTSAFAQRAVLQSGPVTAYDMAVWLQDHTIQSTARLMSEQNRGINPFTILDNGAAAVCTDSASRNGQYSEFCFGHDASGNGLITLDSFGGLGAKVLNFRLNGSFYAYPGTGNGNVVGPNTTLVGELACWNNTTGTLMKQCGTTATVSLLSPTITGTIAGSPTITSPTITGTLAGSPTITTPTISSPSITGTMLPVSTSPASANPTVNTFYVSPGGGVTVNGGVDMDHIRFSHLDGSNNTYTVGANSFLHAINFNLEALAGSDVTSNMRGVIGAITNDGPGTVTALYGRSSCANVNTATGNCFAAKLGVASSQYSSTVNVMDVTNDTYTNPSAKPIGAIFNVGSNSPGTGVKVTYGLLLNSDTQIQSGGAGFQMFSGAGGSGGDFLLLKNNAGTANTFQVTSAGLTTIGNASGAPNGAVQIATTGIISRLPAGGDLQLTATGGGSIFLNGPILARGPSTGATCGPGAPSGLWQTVDGITIHC